MRSSRKFVRSSLRDVLAQQRENTAQTLVYMAEVERRGLHESSGYSSMVEYCVEQLAMDEEDAAERVEVARAGRAFPVLFDAIADGRLHLAGVRMIAPYLTAANVDELVAAMTHRTESEIEDMLAEWFPDLGA